MSVAELEAIHKREKAARAEVCGLTYSIVNASSLHWQPQQAPLMEPPRGIILYASSSDTGDRAFADSSPHDRLLLFSSLAAADAALLLILT